jgi:hypothetical protein
MVGRPGSHSRAFRKNIRESLSNLAPRELAQRVLPGRLTQPATERLVAEKPFDGVGKGFGLVRLDGNPGYFVDQDIRDPSH